METVWARTWELEGARHDVSETDGTRSHGDASSGCRDAPSVETNALMPTKVPEIDKTSRKKDKPPDLPTRPARRRPDESDGLRDHADTLSVRKDAYTVAHEAEVAKNATKNVRTRQIGRRTQYSPDTHEIETPKPAYRWRRIRVDNIDVYVPQNVPDSASSQGPGYHKSNIYLWRGRERRLRGVWRRRADRGDRRG